MRERLEVPEGVPVVDFILSDGKAKPQKKKAVVPLERDKTAELVTLRFLFEKFFDSIPDGNLEASTLSGMDTHEGHFLRIFGPSFDVAQLSLDDLQSYVNQRAKEHTHYYEDQSTKKKRVKVFGATIQKELVTLGTVWSRAVV